MKFYQFGLIFILFFANYSFAEDSLTNRSGQPLKLHQTNVGDADGALALIDEWYYGGFKRSGKSSIIYKIAKVDLNGDGVNEIIGHMTDYSCKRKKDNICTMFVMYLTKSKGKPRWDSMTTTPSGKEVKLLETATKGWYDLAFDDTLYTYSIHNNSGSYHKSETPGELLASKKDLNKQKIEHFGLSWVVASNWSWEGGRYKFNSHQNGAVSYQGFLPNAEKKATVYTIWSAKKSIKEINAYIGDVPYKITLIGSGKINGHEVDIFYLDIKGTENNYGEVYVLFKDQMYFSNQKNATSDLFSRNVSIRLLGNLFEGLKTPKDIQTILDSYVEPFFNTIRVTENNKFATDTTNETTPFELIYQQQNVPNKVKILDKNKEILISTQVEKLKPEVKSSIPTEKKTSKKLSDEKVYQAETLFAPFSIFKTAPIRGKKFIWKDFLVYTEDGWSRDNIKSDESSLVLITSIFNRAIVTLNSSFFDVQENTKDYMINENYKSIKADLSYQQVILHKQSDYNILGNKNCPMITVIIDKKKKMYIFHPYRNGKLYTIVAVSKNIDEKALPSKIQKLLSNILLKSDLKKVLQQPENQLVNAPTQPLQISQHIIEKAVPSHQPNMTLDIQKKTAQALFNGEMGTQWFELSTAGGNFKKFAQIKNKILVVDVPNGNNWGKTGIRSSKPLVKVEENIGKFSAKTTFDFDPMNSTDFVIALIPHNWDGILEWRSHHIRVSLERNEDNKTSSLSLWIRGSQVMKVNVQSQSTKQLSITLQPDHIVLVTDSKDNILLQGLLHKRLSIPEKGYKISVLTHAAEKNMSAKLALKKISLAYLAFEPKTDLSLRMIDRQKLILFDGKVMGNRWQPYVNSKIKFGDAVKVKNNDFDIEIPENSGKANIGIKSSKPIIWLDNFGKGAERKIVFKFNPKKTTGFTLTLANVKKSYIVKWAQDPQKNKAIIQVFINRMGLNSKPIWEQELNSAAPKEVILTLKPGEIILSGDNLPEHTQPWSLIKANSGFDIYAYTSPIAINKSVKMSLKEIILDPHILKPVDEFKPLSGVEPLPVTNLFDKNDSKGWELTPWNSKTIPLETCLLQKDGFLINSVPKKAYLSGCNIHTHTQISLDRRLEKASYQLTANFDPKKTKNFRLIWARDQERHNWSYCELSLLLSKQQQNMLTLKCSYGSNHWQRNIASQWIESEWNGKVNLTLGKNWIEGGLDNGTSIRMDVSPTSKFYTYIHAPNWQHNKTNPELFFTKLTGQWVPNSPMGAIERWDFIDDDKFDAQAFMSEVSNEMDSF